MRFLNNKDYLSIITSEGLQQLTRGIEERFVQAEQAAESVVIGYLSENYEIEDELNKGKRIQPYNRQITYPIGSYFYYEGEICEVLQSLNGYKEPFSEPYWEEYLEDVSLIKHPIPLYSQMGNYHAGDIVKFLDKYYVCTKDHGIDFKHVFIPGITAWNKVDFTDWEAKPYDVWQVVRYQGQFFTLLTKDGYDEFADPIASENWGKIGKYDPQINIYEVSDHEYVVLDEEVFVPVVNVNSDVPSFDGFANIRHNDPRNYNLRRHMVQLALYELHKLISPTNISTVRIEDHNNSIQWLRDANRLKLNPMIPRKLDKKKLPVTDWQMATFQTAYDPSLNPWHF